MGMEARLLRDRGVLPMRAGEVLRGARAVLTADGAAIGAEVWGFGNGISRDATYGIWVLPVDGKLMEFSWNSDMWFYSLGGKQMGYVCDRYWI